MFGFLVIVYNFKNVSLYFVVEENFGSDCRHWSILSQKLETEVITCWCLVLKLITKKGCKMKLCEYNHIPSFQSRDGAGACQC